MNAYTEPKPPIVLLVESHPARCCETPTLRPRSPLMQEVVEADFLSHDEIVDRVSIRALVKPSLLRRPKRRVGSIVW